MKLRLSFVLAIVFAAAIGVFAAGDATTVPFKQIIIAAGDGAKAALGAFDHLIRTTAPVEEKEAVAA